jgi:hypothetical protein
MNKGYVLFNLKEAEEALHKLVQEIETNPGYGRPELSVDLGHVYHHLNHAWNAQDADPRRTENLSHKDFKEWNEFPSEGIFI